VNMDAINPARPPQPKTVDAPSLPNPAGQGAGLPAANQKASVSANFSDIASNNKQSLEVLMNNSKEVSEAIAELKKLADNAGRSLGFSRDSAVSGPVITVTDKDSGKVVRQIPMEVVVRVAHSIEHMKGLLFDKVL